MKPKQPIIPSGYRKLRNDATVKKGDLYFSECSNIWIESVNWTDPTRNKVNQFRKDGLPVLTYIRKVKYIQNVVTDYRNGGLGIIIFQSHKPITPEMIHDYLFKKYNFNAERDTFYMCGDAAEVKTVNL